MILLDPRNVNTGWIVEEGKKIPACRMGHWPSVPLTWLWCLKPTSHPDMTGCRRAGPHAAADGLGKISTESEVRVEKLTAISHSGFVCGVPSYNDGLSEKERSCWPRSLGSSPKAVTACGLFSPSGSQFSHLYNGNRATSFLGLLGEQKLVRAKKTPFKK